MCIKDAPRVAPQFASINNQLHHGSKRERANFGRRFSERRGVGSAPLTEGARQPSMSDVTTRRARKVRLVVGLFATASELTAGLSELATAQLKRGRIRLITPVHALGGALDAWPASGDGRGFAAWIVCRPAQGPFPWALGPADGGAADAVAVEDVRTLLESHDWALRRQAEQLDRHLRGGGALVLVEPDTDAEERASCTALLRHASGGVQTHEIARAHEPGS
jgi:hypothetical protein